MDKKAKKDAITAGQNVNFDNVVVLNDISVSKEKAPDVEEAKKVETESQVTSGVKPVDVPDAEIAPPVQEETNEVPEIPVPKIDIPTIEPQVSADIPNVGPMIPNPIDGVTPAGSNQFSASLDNVPNYDAPSNVLPFNVPGSQDFNSESTSLGNGFGNTDSYDNPMPFNQEANTYDDGIHNSNFTRDSSTFQSSYDSRVPSDVKGTFDMLLNRFAVINGENEELRRKNEKLESEFDAMQKEIMRLRQENAAYEESMNRARASILENFGLSEKKFGNYRESSNDNSFGGMNRVA